MFDKLEAKSCDMLPLEVGDFVVVHVMSEMRVRAVATYIDLAMPVLVGRRRRNELADIFSITESG